MNIYSRIFYVLMFICSLYFVSSLQATEKSGVIDHNERWTLDGSPYLITDDIFITRTGRLTISPGVKIIIDKPFSLDKRFEQINSLDSFTVSIRVEGLLSCVGLADNRISIVGKATDSIQCDWYGIVFDEADKGSEIAFTDIAGSCHGIVVKKSKPVIRNSVFEYNNVALTCDSAGKPQVLNCVIAHNFTFGVTVYKSNPTILNSIIAYNHVNGIWSDGISMINLENNCFYSNGDGDIAGCDPEFGVLVKKNKNGDSVDINFNLFTDPIFKKTKAEYLAVEKDISLPTDKSKIKDTTIAKVLYDKLQDSTASKFVSGVAKRYSLSRYSPCIDAGKKGKRYKDMDNTRNDIGIYGGPEFIEKE